MDIIDIGKNLDIIDIGIKYRQNRYNRYSYKI